MEIKCIVPELLQEQATPDRIEIESLESILNQERRNQMLADYRQMQTAAGDSGVCDRVAAAIFARF